MENDYKLQVMPRNSMTHFHNPESQYVNEIWVKQVAQALSKKHNVKVRKGSGWSANIKTGTLTYGPEIFLLTHSQALGLLSHEIGHLRYTDEPKKAKKGSVNDKYQKLDFEGINCMEDKRIDRIMSEGFLGAKEALGQLYEVSLEAVQSELMTSSDYYLDKIDEVNEKEKIYSDGRKFDPMSFTEASVNIDSLGDRQKPYFRKDRWHVHRETSFLRQILLLATLKFAGKKLPKKFWQKDFVEVAEKISDIWKEKKVKQLNSTQEIADMWREEITPLVSKYLTEEEEAKGVGEPELEGREKNPKDTKTRKIQRLVNKLHEKVHGEDAGLEPDLQTGGMNYLRVRSALMEEIKRYGRKMKKVLDDHMYDKYSGRWRSGKLNTRKLYKTRLQDVRVFQRKIDNDKKDYSFSIVCDKSGSMRGDRSIVARKSMVLINEVLTFCNIPVAIRAFDHSTYVARALGAPTEPKLFRKVFVNTGGGTDVEEAYRLSVPELVAYGRKHKIHICITDGEFTGRDVQIVGERIKKEKGVTFYGIGIHADLPDIYPRGNAFKITDVSQLMPTLIGILKKHIID